MRKCARCGKRVYFDEHPEYDICTRCDDTICADCGVPDPEGGESMCRDHVGENHN